MSAVSLAAIVALAWYSPHATRPHLLPPKLRVPQVRQWSGGGMATRFGTRGDKHAGGPAACPTYTGGRWQHMPISWHRRRGTVGIAHRWLPCYTVVHITLLRTGKVVPAVVVDRGPYGACTLPGYLPGIHKCPRGYWRVKKREDHPGRWQAEVDLLPATAAALGHNGGRERVFLEVKPPAQEPTP